MTVIPPKGTFFRTCPTIMWYVTRPHGAVFQAGCFSECWDLCSRLLSYFQFLVGYQKALWLCNCGPGNDHLASSSLFPFEIEYSKGRAYKHASPNPWGLETWPFSKKILISNHALLEKNTQTWWEFWRYKRFHSSPCTWKGLFVNPEEQQYSPYLTPYQEEE